MKWLFAQNVYYSEVPLCTPSGTVALFLYTVQNNIATGSQSYCYRVTILHNNIAIESWTYCYDARHHAHLYILSTTVLSDITAESWSRLFSGITATKSGEQLWKSEENNLPSNSYLRANHVPLVTNKRGQQHLCTATPEIFLVTTETRRFLRQRLPEWGQASTPRFLPSCIQESDLLAQYSS